MDDRGTREGKQDVLDAWHFPNGPRAETRPSVSVVVLVVDRDLLAPLGGGPTVGVPGVIGSPVVCRGDPRRKRPTLPLAKAEKVLFRSCFVLC